MKTIVDTLALLATVLAYAVVSARDDLRERRKRRALGAHYEGPLDEEGDR